MVKRFKKGEISRMRSPVLPGTTTPYPDNAQQTFSLFRTMLEATGGLSLSQVCTITGLEGSRIQNWVKRGWVARPVMKKYGERQLARILLLNALCDCMQLEQIVRLLAYLNGDVEDSSDDSIEESTLYDYLCILLYRIDPENGIGEKIIRDEVDRITADFVGPHPDSAVRLRRALCVMVTACVAGSFKTQTELLYKQLF